MTPDWSVSQNKQEEKLTESELSSLVRYSKEDGFVVLLPKSVSGKNLMFKFLNRDKDPEGKYNAKLKKEQAKKYKSVEDFIFNADIESALSTGRPLKGVRFLF